MHPKRFALIGGIVMLALGVLSLIPSLYETQNSVVSLPVLNLEVSYGLFLGIFPMNIINKVALILFGVAGIAAANAPTTSLPKSILFSRVTFLVMGAAAVLGLFPETQTFYGYWPLWGNEAAAHGLFALLGLYFGYMLPATAKRENDRRDPLHKKQKPLGI